MATTTWTAASGDWDTSSNWSNGVPSAEDDAVFAQPAGTQGLYIVTGDGPARSLALPALTGTLSLAGTHSIATLDLNAAFGGATLTLPGGAALEFGPATVSGGAELMLVDGATLGSGALTLDNGTLALAPGVLSRPLILAGGGAVFTAGGTLSGLISGTGQLKLDGSVVLSNPGNTYSGGTVIGMDGVFGPPGPGVDHVEIGAGTTGSGPIVLDSGTLTLDPGAIVGPITAAVGPFSASEIDASDQSATAFVGQAGLIFNNGSGHSVIVGATGIGSRALGSFPDDAFGTLTVQGGSGSVTVFGGDCHGAFYGGTAGNNVLVGGADLSNFHLPTHNAVLYQPGPVTMFGGGNDDLLVATGTNNSLTPGVISSNILVAAGGNETLTGSGSTGRNLFFGGTGADVIAAGGGASTIVAGSGTATISGGSASTAIFAGAGTAVVLGGSGADYLQAGAGNATLFAGAGAGMDVIGVINGQAGGSLVVSGFRAGTDQIATQGYAAGPTIAAGGGNTVLTFSDHTQVTLLGVASLPGGVVS